MISKTRDKVLYPILFILILLAGGCLKQAPPLHYHTLTSSEQPSAAEQRFARTVLVGPVRVTSTLDRRQLVKQHSAHSVTIAEQHRWAGDLPEMLTNVLVTNLSRDLNSERVYTFPGNYDQEGLQVEIHFLHFEGEASGQANVTARWKIIAAGSHDILHAETSTHGVKLNSEDYDELARGLSLGLSRLSHEIAEKLTVTP